MPLYAWIAARAQSAFFAACDTRMVGRISTALFKVQNAATFRARSIGDLLKNPWALGNNHGEAGPP